MRKKRIAVFLALFLITVVFSGNSWAQPKWQRSEPQIGLRHRLFHSTKVVGLPTAEALNKGDLEIEISHRFQPPISEGYDALYGLDGPAKMRIAVGYAFFNNCLVTLGRSNYQDNTDLEVKYQFLHPAQDKLPILAAFQIGGAWNIVETYRLDQNGDMLVRGKGHERHFQYYGRVILDYMPISRFVVGLVPSYLYNSDISAKDIENTFMLGTHYQVFLYKRLSLIGEWSPILSNKSNRHNPAGFGIEIETGAHIFEIIVTNQTRINSSQYITGSDYSFKGDNLRFGFFLSRIL